jgi:DNA polymerase-3 subunit alpha
MVAVINNFGGFYFTELYLHELKRTGVKVLAPCINESTYLTNIRGNVVHLGFVHVIGMQQELVEKILLERKLHGPFLHLYDFLERTRCPLEQLNLLIRVGAFRFTNSNKKALLWEANFLQKKFAKRNVHAALFEEKPVSFSLPHLEQTLLEDAYDEIELLGFPLCNVWDLVDADLTKYCTAADLPANLGKVVETVGYFITDKHVHTKHDKSMFFGTFLDKEGNWLDTVHFPESFRWTPFSGRGYYALRGKVVEEFGVYTIEASHCYKLGRKKIAE